MTDGKTLTAAPDLLPGTLEMLVLKTLAREPQHGYGIASQRLKFVSEEVVAAKRWFYPALQRLLMNGLGRKLPEWRVTENNRRARYYSITKAGLKYMASESAQFDRMVRAIHRVMQTT